MKSTIALLVLPAFFILSCSSKPDLETAKKEIKTLLQQERKAHFDRNVDLFVSEFADSLISVNKGKVTTLSPEQNKKRIEPYFSSVQFIKWDDAADPVIRFSDDASLAYAVVQKQVILSYPDSFGNSFIDTTNYAWVSIYRKHKGKWKVEANISTSQ